MRDVTVGPHAQLVGEHLIQTYSQFPTVILDHTHVRRRSLEAEIRGDGTLGTAHNHVRTLVGKDIERTGNQTAKERIVET